MATDGLLPVRHQAIAWINADLWAVGPMRTNFSEIWMKIQNKIFHEDANEYVVCEMLVTSFMPICAKNKCKWISPRRVVYLALYSGIGSRLEIHNNNATDHCRNQDVNSVNSSPPTPIPPPDKMAAISLTPHSNAFSWMGMLEFRFKFHRSLFLRFQLTITQQWFR